MRIGSIVKLDVDALTPTSQIFIDARNEEFEITSRFDDLYTIQNRNGTFVLVGFREEELKVIRK